MPGTSHPPGPSSRAADDILLKAHLNPKRTSRETGLAKAEIGIIGGSGLYNMDGLTNVTEHRIETPFGAPSEVFALGTLEGRKVAFLARPRQGPPHPP